MVELSPVAAAVLVVVGTIGAFPIAGAAASEAVAPTVGADASATTANQTGTPGGPNGTLAPGEQLAAVIGVQQAGISGELERRAFGQRVAAAASNTSKAGVVRAEVEQLRDRLDELREDRRELRAAHRNGSISTGEYRARLTRIHAQSRALQRQVDTTRQVTESLPEAALEARGVNASAIVTLRTEARNLTGPEVAEIARGIAGNSADRGVGPDRRGPPAVIANVTGPGAGQARGPDDGQGPQGNASGPGASPQGRNSGDGPPGDDSQGPPDDEPGPDDDAGQSDGASDADATESNGGQSTGETGANDGGADDRRPGNESEPGDGQGPPDDGTSGDDTSDGDSAGSGSSGDDTSDGDSAGSGSSGDDTSGDDTSGGGPGSGG